MSPTTRTFLIAFAVLVNSYFIVDGYVLEPGPQQIDRASKDASYYVT